MIGSTLMLKAGSVLLAESPGNPCPKPPPGLKQMMSDFTSYAKFGTMWAVVIAFFVSLIVLTAGRILDHHGAAKKGSIGIAVSVGAAALFGAGYAILTGIFGSGC
ncbi:MAG: hypothetical protein ABI140_11785 [Jatrophihabitantaceae bacterium]